MSELSLSCIPAAYVRAINNHDPTGFIELFADEAIVNYVGRDYHGIEYIRQWSESDIFAANITLEVLETRDQSDATDLKVRIHGDYDRATLPSPLVMWDQIRCKGGKIAKLACGVANGEQRGA